MTDLIALMGKKKQISVNASKVGGSTIKAFLSTGYTPFVMESP